MSSHRQLVQYSDLDHSEQINGASSSAARIHPPRPPKKRKRSNPRTRRPPNTAHWDDTGDLTSQIDYDYGYDYDDGDAHAEGEIEEESRELTHEEMWDDSALIDAWNSATAEYEAFHGKSQDWKSESKPVKKSPLWYNIPYDSSKEKATVGARSSKASGAEAASRAVAVDEEDSAPLDFNTFVPSHDPSLPMSSEPQPAPDPSFFVPAPSTTMVSRDEAFNRALSAMYWGGYWTAVYHCQTRQPSQEVGGEEDQECEEIDGEAPEDDSEDLVPAQR